MTKRILTAITLTLALSGAAVAARSAPATPFEINAVLPTTGGAAFLGSKEAEALGVLEAYVNKTGGVAGRPIKFVVADDATNPQNSIQLTSGLIAKKVNVIIGSALVATCGSMETLVAKAGPVTYCLSPVIQPAAGSYLFSANVGTKDFIPVIMDYFRAHHLNRVALITTTDASGKDFADHFTSSAAGPDGAGLQLVANEQYNPADLSIAAQLARVKAATPQVLMTFAVGPAFGTLVRSAHDAGLELPMFGSSANLVSKQLVAYRSMIKEIYFVAGGGAAADPGAPPKQRAAQTAYFTAFKDAGMTPEYLHTLAWDPAMIFIEALRRLGTDATPQQIHDYIEGQTNWYGITGKYDFTANSQRGIGRDGVAIYRWDAARDQITTIPRK
jgi:branched-chain amino acid transport system substrate-binding protein